MKKILLFLGVVTICSHVFKIPYVLEIYIKIPMGTRICLASASLLSGIQGRLWVGMKQDSCELIIVLAGCSVVLEMSVI